MFLDVPQRLIVEAKAATSLHYPNTTELFALSLLQLSLRVASLTHRVCDLDQSHSGHHGPAYR